jgi:hypothetical protein
VELIHSDSNLKFDMGVVFTINYYFNGKRHPRRQRGDQFCESQDQVGSAFWMCS